MTSASHHVPPAEIASAERALPEVPDEVVASWQYIVNSVTARLRVPVGLVMRIVGEELEVLVANDDSRNPHHVGERATIIGSGMYCERVLGTGNMLCVPDALVDALSWRGNPCLEQHGLRAYLGFPIRWPDGRLFGTLCALDTGEYPYSKHDREVMALMRDLIESNLRTLFDT